MMESGNLEKFDIFPWNTNFETNVEIIDKQHKKLVEILNRLAFHLIHSSSDITLDSVFEELIEYTNYHFNSEEKYWSSYLLDDTWYKNHEKMHRSFVSKVLELKNQESDKSVYSKVQDIVSFLTHWLAFHILDSDKRMAYVVKQLKEGYSAEKAKEYSNVAMSGLMETIIETVLNMYDKLSSRTLDLMREKSLRKQAEQALLVSEERWDFILKGSEESIWEWNLLSEEKKSSIQNSEFFRFLTQKDNNLNTNEKEIIVKIHPDDIDTINNALQKHLDGKTDFFTVDYRVIRDNDSWSWISSKGKVVERDNNGTAVRMVGTHSDISERELSSVIFRQGYQAIIITDANYSVKNINPTFTKITGFKGEEVLGTNFFAWFFKHDKLINLEQLKNKLSLTGSWNNEVTVQTKTGDELTALTDISSIRSSDNSIEHYVILFTDISARKKIEKELLEAKIKAEESDKLKSAFLSNISHEIRTPMNGIMGFSSLLNEPGLTGDNQQEFIDGINYSCHRMQNILKEIVDISMIESGQMKINLANTNLNRDLDKFYDKIKYKADEKGLEIFLEKGLADNEVNITTDKEKLISILENLLLNAIKYTDRGSVKFGYIKRDDLLEFYVNDTGIGIKSNRQNAIFESFVQAEIEDIEARQGAGLGLAIAKEFAKLLGGEIWVKSDAGKGSTFYFTIQYNSASDPKSPNIISNQSNHKLFDNSKPKVLIVDDDLTSQLFISYVIKPISTEIVTASSGKEAIEICQKNMDIDLILMDIQMPFINGIEATKRIREFNKDVIIVAQTVFALSDDKDKTLEAGCNDFITKPIDKNELIKLIGNYFKVT